MPETGTLTKIRIPLQLQVGDVDQYSLISLMHLYNACSGNVSYFDQLVAAATSQEDADSRSKNLGILLLKDNRVLPLKCFDELFTRLNDEKLVAFVRPLLEVKVDWKKMQKAAKKQAKSKTLRKYVLGTTRGEIMCAWPDCPDEKT
ncbi:MAG: hypothetical protein NTU47_04400 [Ignavibacteriales bacterium]|nr:hypothetical protein [Ignavibacteriales bacterium]